MFNGMLVAANTGKPPAVPPGYIRNIDPFIFEPILDSCTARIEKDIPSKCCKVNPVTWCSHFEKVVLPIDCKHCKEIQYG